MLKLNLIQVINKQITYMKFVVITNYYFHSILLKKYIKIIFYNIYTLRHYSRIAICFTESPFAETNDLEI